MLTPNPTISSSHAPRRLAPPGDPADLRHSPGAARRWQARIARHLDTAEERALLARAYPRP